MKRTVYLDNAATTKVFPGIIPVMDKYHSIVYGNPSGKYALGRQAHIACDKARKQVASFINAKPEEIYFTSCGTEADNWVLLNAVMQSGLKNPHIITSKIEHHAILNYCQILENYGVEVTYVGVDEKGMVRISEIVDAIKHNTVLISIMYANNEVGVIQPIEQISLIAKKSNILFHTDAVGACGHTFIDVKQTKVDYLSGSGHKFNGPKGMGFLYVSSRCEINPMIVGGGQQNKMRAGTENVPGIVGLGMAAEMTKNMLVKKIQYETMLRERLISRVLREIKGVRLNGDRENRISNNANFSFKDIESENLLMLLEEDGIFASGGSACSNNSNEPSHVLGAIGLSKDVYRGAVRLTIGYNTTISEIDYTVESIKKNVRKLREGSVEYLKE